MKKYIVSLAACLISSSSFALTHSAKLKIHVSGKMKHSYYLCVSNVGCVNIIAGVKGHVFPLAEGEISHVFLANSKDYRMYPQPLPQRCNVTIKANHTLVVSGKITTKANDALYIDRLSCAVVNG